MPSINRRNKILFSLRHSSIPPPPDGAANMLLLVTFTMETVVTVLAVVMALTVVREEFVGKEAF